MCGPHNITLVVVYILYLRHLDTFPNLFVFIDIVELELAVECMGVPDVVIDVLHDNWWCLLCQYCKTGARQEPLHA